MIRDQSECEMRKLSTPLQIKAYVPTHMRLHYERGCIRCLRDMCSLLRRHIVLTLFLCRGILVLLVLRHKIVHVGLCFRKFHFVHALSSVPMQKSFAPEHGGEVFGDAFEHLLNCGRPC